MSETPKQINIDSFDGLSLNVWDWNGAGPALLLLYCTGTMSRIWDPVVDRLTRDFRVLAADTRGQGDSAHPAKRDAYIWKNSGRDLLSIVDALNLGPGTVAVGHSGGAAHVAYAEHLRPGVFQRVMLIDAIIGPEEAFQGPNILAEKSRRRVNEFESREEARERFASKPPMNAWHPEALDAYVAHALKDLPDGRVGLKCPGDREAWFYELGGATDIFAELDSMPIQAMLVTGGDSYVKPLAELQHSLMPHADFRVVDGAGHFIPQEKPAEVAALIDEFLV